MLGVYIIGGILGFILLLGVISGISEAVYDNLFPNPIIKELKKQIENLYEDIDNNKKLQESKEKIKLELNEKTKIKLNIPQKYEIGPDDLPRVKNLPLDLGWGDELTVYLTPTGYRYHILPHCSLHSYPANIAIASEEYTPCLICCNNYTAPELSWYKEYQHHKLQIIKLEEEIDKLNSEIDAAKNNLIEKLEKIKTERNTLNKRRYQFMLNHMPKTNFELKRIDSILNKDIKDYCVPNIQKKEKLDVQRSEQTNEYVTPSVIPASIALDSNDLPYIKLREYGYGKKFNAFVTERSDCYHRSKCSAIRFHKKKVIHRYEALKKYRPCTICKPIDYVDDWYKTYMSEKSNQKPENTEFPKASISIPPVLNLDAEVQAKLNEIVERYQKEKQK